MPDSFKDGRKRSLTVSVHARSLSCALFALGASVAFGATSDLDRQAADRRAKQAFRETVFHANGNGMGMVPDLISASAPVLGFPPIFRPDLDPAGKTLERRWGLERENGRPVGLFNVRHRGMQIGAFGCVVCHSGKAYGQVIVGLGNKHIDVHQLGKDAAQAGDAWARITDAIGTVSGQRKSAEYRRVEQDALGFARLLSDPRISNLTQGMVPVAFIRTWFYTAAGLTYPGNLPRGAVKVPMLWGYGEKRKVGQFCDGYGDGLIPGWGAAVELVAGQKPEVVRGYIEKMEAAEQLFADFLPPPYPLPIDRGRAERGRARFENTCATCHGTYRTDGAGLPIYEAPRWIPWEVVRTDGDRLDGNTPEFQTLVERSPINDLVRTRVPGRGYFAPRLNGIWARFPYLHNGSIPNLEALLTPPAQRPRLFSLRDSGETWRFDPERLGLTVPRSLSVESAKLLVRARWGDREVYSTDRIGHSNQGHAFFTELLTAEKRDLIEYLKTL